MRIDNNNKYEVGKLYYTSLLYASNNSKKWAATSGIISFTIDEQGNILIDKLHTRKTPIGITIQRSLGYQIKDKKYIYNTYEEAVKCHDKRVLEYLPSNPEYFSKYLINQDVDSTKLAELWYKNLTRQEKEYIKLLSSKTKFKK